MSKSIIFCADGTWNAPGDADTIGDRSNVYKLYYNLDGIPSRENINLKEEQEKTTADGNQISKYIHGVGDSANPLVKLMGGAVGAGTVIRILRGYTFISRNYRPGDRIFIIGFSRGAYTARALAGMITTRGLLDPEHHDLADKELAYRLAAAEWYSYRRQKAGKGTHLFARLQSLVVDFPHFFQKPVENLHLIENVPIDTVAVWDTVGALGVPVFDVSTGYPVDVFQFANTALSQQVENGIHFISVDEQRALYTPTLWDERDGIDQVLYPGAHSDVGGGYPDCGLSDCALHDMQELLATRGVRFADPPHYAPDPNPLARAHAPWLEPGLQSVVRGPRQNLQTIRRSECFTKRLNGGPVFFGPGDDRADYRPGNIN